MSLAMYASPYNDSDDNKETSPNIQNKRVNRSKTLKRLKNPNGNVNSEKVEAMLNSIHQNSSADSEEGNLATFNPPPPAESAGAERMDKRDKSDSSQIPSPAVNNIPNGLDNDVTQENFQQMPGGFTREYFDKYIPYYTQAANTQNNLNNNDIGEKLNYLIHLLEEQKDERTGHVTEELVLYSFLGVFVIFVVDSFARAGKYVR